MAESPFTHKLVVVVRRNLRLSPGKLSVQVAHAAVACALRAQESAPKAFREWMREGQKKVVVRVETERDFHSLRETAEAVGLPTALVQDAGLTEVPPGTVTVLGIGPGAEGSLDRVTGHLPLL